MSKFYSLFSSSKGNASFIGGPAGGMLVDAGATCRKLVQSLEAHGLSTPTPTTSRDCGYF